MNVSLVANYPPDGQESMLRFASMLERGLESRSVEVRVVRPRRVLGSNGWEGGFGSKWLGYLDKFGVFLPRLREVGEWADVVHICDHANALYHPFISGAPVLITCHDLLAVRTATGELTRWEMGWGGGLLQRLILRALDSASRVVCISEETRRQFERIVDVSEKHVTRIYNGLNYDYRPMDPPRVSRHCDELGIPPDQPYYLHVGGNQWYKNRPGVLRIYRELDRLSDRSIGMVMVGKPFTEEMRAIADRIGTGDRIYERVGVTNEELRALYSGADGLIFPSLNEGFGWPIAEAHACGCPVFTTDRPPMTEVGGPASVYFDPEFPAEAARTIHRHVNDRDRMREDGLENARRFDPDRMIDRYVEEYRKAASRDVRPHRSRELAAT